MTMKTKTKYRGRIRDRMNDDIIVRQTRWYADFNSAFCAAWVLWQKHYGRGSDCVMRNERYRTDFIDKTGEIQ